MMFNFWIICRKKRVNKEIAKISLDVFFSNWLFNVLYAFSIIFWSWRLLRKSMICFVLHSLQKFLKSFYYHRLVHCPFYRSRHFHNSKSWFKRRTHTAEEVRRLRYNPKKFRSYVSANTEARHSRNKNKVNDFHLS